MVSFTGAYTIQPTPFLSGGEGVNLEAQRAFVEWQVSSGVPGLILLGTIGEVWALSDVERLALMDATIAQVSGRVPVLVGVSQIDTAAAARQARQAEDAGADGVMLSPPSYVNATQDEVLRHIGSVCERTTLPVMIYNNPQMNGVDVPPATLARMARSFEQVRYVKEASGDVGRVADIVELSDGTVDVFAGSRVIESFALGATGYTSVYGAWAPHASVRIWSHLNNGDIGKARRLQRVVDQIEDTVAAGHPLYGHTAYVKALIERAGHPMGDVRPPLTPLGELERGGRDMMERLTPMLTTLTDMLQEESVGAGR